MRHPVLVVCEMLEDEIRCITEKHRLSIPTIWVDRGLHDYPVRLHRRLAEIIAELDGFEYDGILLGFMLCGNALDGIRAGNLPIIFPRFHDCIDMQLSQPRDPYAFYLTAGWLKGSVSLLNTYEQAVLQYGEKKAKKFLDLSLKNYKSLTMIDTGAYPCEETLAIPQKLSALCGLPLTRCSGNYTVLEKLLCGVWDEQFCTLHPHETLSAAGIFL